MGLLGLPGGYALALMMGSLLLIVAFQSRHAVNWRAIMRTEHLPLVIVCLAVVGVGVVGADWAPIGWSKGMLWCATLALPLLPLCVVVWLHPLRVVLWDRFSKPSAGTQGS